MEYIKVKKAVNENDLLDEIIKEDYIDSYEWLSEIKGLTETKSHIQKSELVDIGAQLVSQKRTSYAGGSSVKNSISNVQFLNMSKDVVSKQQDLISKNHEIAELKYKLEQFERFQR